MQGRSLQAEQEGCSSPPLEPQNSVAGAASLLLSRQSFTWVYLRSSSSNLLVLTARMLWSLQPQRSCDEQNEAVGMALGIPHTLKHTDREVETLGKTLVEAPADGSYRLCATALKTPFQWE